VIAQVQFSDRHRSAGATVEQPSARGK